ncbi:MAG: DNA translocase FtsK [Bacteroidota bacterium]
MAKRRTSSRKKSSKKAANPGLITVFFQWVQAMRTQPESREQVRKISAWSLIFLGLVSLIACISYYFTGHADQSVVDDGFADTAVFNNWLGFVGAKLAEWIIRRGFGFFGFIPILYGLLLGLILLEDDYYDFAKRLFKYALFVVFFGSVFFAYIEILSRSGSYDLGGGVGHAINNWLIAYMGSVGMAFLLLFAIVMFVVVNFNAELRASMMLEKLSAVKLPQVQVPVPSNQPKRRQNSRTGTALKQKLSGQGNPATSVVSQGNQGLVMVSSPVTARSVSPAPVAQVGQELQLQVSPPVDRPKPVKKKAAPEKKDQSLELTIVEVPEEKSIPLPEPKKLTQIGEDNIGKVVGEDRIEKIVPEEDQEIENVDEIFEAEDYDPTLELSGYERPAWELLEDHGSGRGREVNREELENNKNKIVQTLEDYGIKIVTIKATIGPTVTLYEIVPAPGIRISKIKNLEDDIALSLAALGIRIIAPIPGKGTIGIEVPNSKPEIVSLRGVLTTEKFINTKAELPIAIGRTISNEVFIADLNKMPHLLIAGATGQGKSVGLNTVITSLLYKKHPAEVKFVLIDPKKVEMSLYQSLSHHFLAQLPDQGEEPIITDVREAVNVLKSLCVEMDIRYELLKKARVRNLKEYNTKFKNRKLSPKKGHRFMPYIVLVIDELADMMMVAGKEVEMPIARLAQLARAVGIHLVVATQRPSVNVITGIIKANFPARMSYRVISKVDSRTILDANGADQLIGRGDVLLSTGSDLIRIQNAFIDTPEVERIVDHISHQRGFPEPYFLPELPSEDGGSDSDDEPFEKDSRFEEAARMIVKYQIGSASLIQRKMKLGYNRAGRIIDQLERANIVGPHSGSKARDVLMSDEVELERYLSTL